MALSGCCTAPAPAAQARETVILVHGLGRTRLSLWILSRRLRAAGFRAVLFPYNQAAEPLEAIAARLRETAAREARGGRYHLVGHSLGGVIIREGFREGYPAGLGRVVMLAPPNRPPLLALGLKGAPPFRWFAGDSGAKLADPAFYTGLPKPDVEFGVIAGTRGNRLLSEAPNDGVVLVETTKLEGMADFRELRKTHTFLMNSREAFELTVRFLESGRFELR